MYVYSIYLYECMYALLLSVNLLSPMHVVALARSRLAQINSKLLQQIVEKQSVSRIFHMDVIEEFSREGLLSTIEAEVFGSSHFVYRHLLHIYIYTIQHLLEDVQRAAANEKAATDSD